MNSVYIHIPFCNNICSYCDFCKMYYNQELVDKYLNELQMEIKSKYKGELIKTIYIGGGTPSSLNLDQLNKLFEITKLFNFSNDVEFTIEVNVNDICEDKLVLFKNNHINRISIGVETINDKFLSLLNRFHTKDLVIDNINLVKKYFSNINIDFMYGFNNETINDLKNDLDFFIDLDVTHISIYSLILEEHTKLYIDKIKPIDENLESEMYYYIIDYLNKYGYSHYEISNFSKKKYESRHNLVYWNNDKYYGFGLGASGYIDNIRYSNTRSINKYLNGEYLYEEELINDELNMEYEVILGLRKINGISKNEFFCKYQCNIYDKFDIIKLINNNMLIDDGKNIFIPKDKLYVSNSILINFVGGSNE